MGITDDSLAVVRRQIKSVEFGFYTDQDVRERSVVEITSSLAFDPLSGNPLPGGLCDPKMGPTDNYDPTPCPTCALKSMQCPGHFGHIELVVPVHHPLLVPEILTVLRAKCMVCHKLRAAQRQLATFRAKFHLLHQGRIVKFHGLDHEMQVALGKRGQGAAAEQKGDKAIVAAEAALTLDEFLKQYQPPVGESENQENMAFSTSRPKRRKYNSYERTLREQLIKECLSICKVAKSCPHCGAFSPKIRQDSSNKFFRKNLSTSSQRTNRLSGLHMTSALEDGNGYQSEDSEPRRRQPVETHPATTGDNNSMEQDSDNGDEGNGDEDDDKKNVSADQFMHTKEVQAQLKRTWATDPYLMNCLFGSGGDEGVGANGYQIFFMQAVPVPPNKFRPSLNIGIAKVEHSQNHYLSNIIISNEKVRDLFQQGKEPSAYTAWINLQTAANCFMDSSKDTSLAPQNQRAPGIRQLLERKEGLFRKNMMGKRVDFACRSVISPDPYVGTNEIGLPLYFAQVLTYPTPVTQLNIKEMRTLVERGPLRYPGARWVETFVGGRQQRLDLTKMKAQSRMAVAAMLLTNLKKSGGRPAIVGRQLRDGDYVLMNRQPTLHKPGIMAHRVRILHNPNQKTIRMHYSNCDTYNADFDGDEMNCHFPQNDIARAETYYIARTNLQFIVPTDGSPLRGLIQDHVVGGVMLTKLDTFLEKWEYQQLLFACLASLPGLEVIRSDAEIEMVPPTIMKPREYWTGKQVITTVLLNLRRGSDRDDARLSNLPGITMERKAKTPATAFGEKLGEHVVHIRDGELLRGVLDKAAFGATNFSLVHCVHEAYGPERAGIFLNALSRLFTAYIQYFAGHSCRTEDLVLTKKADEERRKLVQRAYNLGARAAKAWADSEGGKVPIPPVTDITGSSEPLKPVEVAAASAKIGELLSGNEGAQNFAALDGYMQGQLNPLSSEIVKKSLPDGLVVPFPFNTFGVMTTTGAKGSIVNQSQITCALGQQALEGRRVPRMSSGRTLPSFAPYDPNPRADGFVMDRFLTGIRPQEYYFHCMAGREGLVDTAVKTSRSGYLQRCLVKHLEELKICYDFTVRNGENGVVQFLYGEDGLDPTKASFLDCSTRSIQFFAKNTEAVSRQNSSLPNSMIDLAAADATRHQEITEKSDNLLRPGARVRARKLREGNEWKRGALCQGWFEAIVTKVHEGSRALDLQYIKDGTIATKVPITADFGQHPILGDLVARNAATLVEPIAFDPIISAYDRGHVIGSSGACVSERVAKFAYDQIKNNKALHETLKRANVSPEQLGKLIATKYSGALCAPGEAVGSIAAQSIGEPSTQMTLNTFHLAGAGANVTLGIPRLREIIMTASKELKTPTMSVPIHDFVDDKAALRLTRSFTKLTLMELISGDRGISVTEKLERSAAGSWERFYRIRIKFHPSERITEAFGLSIQDISKIVGGSFMATLTKLMKIELKRSLAEDEMTSTEVRGGDKTQYIPTDGDDGGGEGQGHEGRGEEDLFINDKDDDDEEEEEVDDEGREEDGADADKQRGRKQIISYDDEDEELPDDETKEYNNDEEIDNEGEDEGSKSSSSENTSLAGTKGEENANQMSTKSNTIALEALSVDPAARPLLMVGLVEKAARKVLVSQRKKIDQAFVNAEDNGRGRCLQTAGVNFEEIWDLTEVDHNRLMSNDIWATCCAYGVEAARSLIGQQISSVFGVYGIEVDPRHLSLIGDYMTFEGGFKAMSRIGMKQSSSAFLQMSFETTAEFLKRAAISRDSDSISSPSANLVVGRPIRHGTGILECLASEEQ